MNMTKQKSRLSVRVRDSYLNETALSKIIFKDSHTLADLLKKYTPTLEQVMKISHYYKMEPSMFIPFEGKYTENEYDSLDIRHSIVDRMIKKGFNPKTLKDQLIELEVSHINHNTVNELLDPNYPYFELSAELISAVSKILEVDTASLIPGKIETKQGDNPADKLNKEETTVEEKKTPEKEVIREKKVNDAMKAAKKRGRPARAAVKKEEVKTEIIKKTEDKVPDKNETSELLADFIVLKPVKPTNLKYGRRYKQISYSMKQKRFIFGKNIREYYKLEPHVMIKALYNDKTEQVAMILNDPDGYELTVRGYLSNYEFFNLLKEKGYKEDSETLRYIMDEERSTDQVIIFNPFRED